MNVYDVDARGIGYEDEASPLRLERDAIVFEAGGSGAVFERRIWKRVEVLGPRKETRVECIWQ